MAMLSVGFRHAGQTCSREYFQLADSYEDLSAKQLLMSRGYLHTGSAVKPPPTCWHLWSYLHIVPAFRTGRVREKGDL